MSWAPVKTAVRVGWGSTLAAFWIHWTAEYICEPSLTFGPSMLPTIPVADSWSLSLRRYKHGKGIKVGDVIEFERPTGPGTRAIKRVIGMPGDLVVVGPRMLEKDAASPPQRQSPENSAPQDLHPSRMIRVSY